MTLRGLTWDHPRAYRPLQAFAAHCPDLAVSWDRQSLADFEARPIATLAQSYDLMIIDHPGLGAALAAHALQPLDQLVPAGQLAEWQAGLGRPDLGQLHHARWPAMGGPHRRGHPGLRVPPRSAGRRAPRLGRRARAGPAAPHRAVPGRPARVPHPAGHVRPGPAPRDELLPPREAAEALGILQAVWAAADQDISQADPIGVHEALAAGTVAYCPLAYGYASYARPAAGRHALAWADAPTFGSARPGSVLGGTGLAVSAPRRPDPAEVRGFLTAFLAPDVQAGLVPAHGGQPAQAAAWDSAAVDQAWGGYYRAVRRSLDAAWVRPRADGWIAVQDQASALVRAAISGQASAQETTTVINASYRELARPERAEAGST